MFLCITNRKTIIKQKEITVVQAVILLEIIIIMIIVAAITALEEIILPHISMAKKEHMITMKHLDQRKRKTLVR